MERMVFGAHYQIYSKVDSWIIKNMRFNLHYKVWIEAQVLLFMQSVQHFYWLGFLSFYVVIN